MLALRTSLLYYCSAAVWSKPPEMTLRRSPQRAAPSADAVVGHRRCRAKIFSHYPIQERETGGKKPEGNIGLGFYIFMNSSSIHSSSDVLDFREAPDLPLQLNKLHTVTYGMKSSPFLAIWTLRQLAWDEETKYPPAARLLCSAMYMDDILASLELRKWVSNRRELLSDVDHLEKHDFDNADSLNLCENLSKGPVSGEVVSYFTTTTPRRIWRSKLQLSSSENATVAFEKTVEEVSDGFRELGIYRRILCDQFLPDYRIYNHRYTYTRDLLRMWSQQARALRCFAGIPLAMPLLPALLSLSVAYTIVTLQFAHLI
ncbi:hypothetical protein EVAR_81996_1 [Eumeta japonica]|uniref:Uncharacterized protein n=1 Tax=Eumeta variegata TaxID=151549 RepID=A0A4C1VTQ9_EUMVA|nr:hypothetical protein EVAR_81996_1 [Eumeta japonica]